jgi:hypothetical protein
VQSKARWKPDEVCNKTEIIDAFNQFVEQENMFKQVQLATMEILCDDMEDACYGELPYH